MILDILLVLIAVSAFLDYKLSSKILNLAIDLEENTLTKWLCKKFGIRHGLILGIAVPTASLIGLFKLFELQTFAALILGMRLMLNIRQFYTWAFFCSPRNDA